MSGPEIIILAPVLLLALGALLRHASASLLKINKIIPYTVQLLLIGGGIGIALRSDRWDGAALQQSFLGLASMDPHLMMHIFLPPLIFESAASLEWHLFSRQKWFIQSLAGPGLLAASALTGYLLHWLNNSNEGRFGDDACTGGEWPLSAGLLLGVILSATDPVAVVALLRDLGCKASLTTTIEGESLLNDGTALVLFTILLDFVQGGGDAIIVSSSWDSYVWSFFKMAGGGALFGTAFGVIIIVWLGKIFNDALSEISLTLVSAYLCFFIAEFYLHVSGVIAVCCLGLYFGHHGRTSISPEVAHFLHEFWELLGYFANTLIAFVAGAVIGYKMPVVEIRAYLRLVIVYCACIMIRATVIFAIFGIFRAFGSPLELKDQVVAIWGGVRGAVGLSLAMIVYDSPTICQSIRDETIFYTAGIVLLTSLINSPTMPLVLKFLGMRKMSLSKQLVHHQAMSTIQRAGEKQELNLRADHCFDSTLWSAARSYYFQRLDGKSKDNHRRHRSFRRSSAMSSSDGEPSDLEVDATELRRRVLMVMKRSYWRQFQDGFLSRRSVKYLLHHTDSALDTGCSLKEWNVFAERIQLSSTFNQREGVKDVVKLSPAQLRKRRCLSILDSIPALVIILAAVILSCLAPVLPKTVPFMILEHAITVLFVVELGLRLYCIGNLHAFALDGYLILDSIVIAIDLVLIGAGDFLGNASTFVVAGRIGRIIRFLKLLRLLRLGRVYKRFAKISSSSAAERESLMFSSNGKGLIDKYRRRVLYSQLLGNYEMCLGFKSARQEALSSLRLIDSSSETLIAIRDSIEKDIRLARSAMLDTERLYSEIASSITTSVATRTVLNSQRRALEQLHNDGFIDSIEFNKLRGAVEYQQKRLSRDPPIISMPKKTDMLSRIPWLQCLSAEQIAELSEAVEESVFKNGDNLVRQGDVDTRLHLVARGTVKVFYDKPSGERVEIDEIGLGSVFGEVSFLLKHERGASVVGSSTGLIFSIDGQVLEYFLQNNPELDRRLWDTAGRRLSENLLCLHLEGEDNTTRIQIRDAVHEMKVYSATSSNTSALFRPTSSDHVVLLKGMASYTSETSGRTDIVEGPAVLDPSSEFRMKDGMVEMELSTGTKYMCHPKVRKRNRGRASGGMRASHTAAGVPITIPLHLHEDKNIPSTGENSVQEDARRSSSVELECKTTPYHEVFHAKSPSTRSSKSRNSSKSIGRVENGRPKVKFRQATINSGSEMVKKEEDDDGEEADGAHQYLHSPDRSSESSSGLDDDTNVDLV